MIKLNEKMTNLIEECECDCKNAFENIEKIALSNQLKVLNAFNEVGIEQRHFIGSSGYGYDDIGKIALSKLFCEVFHTETGLVSPLISSGTEAISHTLFGLLRPNDLMLSITGRPYDTLQKILFGVEGQDIGSLKDYNINYDEIDLKNGDFDSESIISYLEKTKPTLIYVQRSRGYSQRNALSIEKIKNIFAISKRLSPNSLLVVDNCYGEFTEEKEPSDVGADIIIGSLIKNAGGGIAPNGGYILGKKQLIDRISYHCTSPALGDEVGSYAPGYKSFMQGLFLSPIIVKNSKKIALLTSKVMRKLGYKTIPENDEQSDIICSIQFDDSEKLVKFCRAIQNASPIDSNAYTEPSDMAGYADKIVMASGSFNLGSSIELSCDAPIRPPYTAYMQGGLTYEHGKIALNYALQQLLN
ncbi:MAG: methionine gamma-lyase family protein [Clostridia bacterium]|nr:methionine gamma-lyase family protein [Clostridia bacterium]